MKEKLTSENDEGKSCNSKKIARSIIGQFKFRIANGINFIVISDFLCCYGS